MTTRTRWGIFWATLAAIVAGAYVYIALTGQWEGSLTNTILSLVDRHPWLVGIPFMLGLVWLVLHFGIPIFRRWREELNKEEDGSC